MQPTHHATMIRATVALSRALDIEAASPSTHLLPGNWRPDCHYQPPREREASASAAVTARVHEAEWRRGLSQ